MRDVAGVSRHWTAESPNHEQFTHLTRPSNADNSVKQAKKPVLRKVVYMGEIYELLACRRFFKGRYKDNFWVCNELLGHDGPCCLDRRGELPAFVRLKDQEHTRQFRCYTGGDLMSALQWACPGDSILVEDGSILAGHTLPASVRIMVMEEFE